MLLVDTHTHLYLEQFSNDRTQVVQNAIVEGIEYMLLPNIDQESFQPMHNLCDAFPENCYPMIGLHPTSVKENYEDELLKVEKVLRKGIYCAVGEIGIDLYWDKTFIEHQKDALRSQIHLAKKHKLPVSIHTREAFNEIYKIVKEESVEGFTGVFHCFTGTLEQARKIVDIGFYLGIGGVVTFKNSKLDEVLNEIPIECLVLETDSPFLAPAPYRGKRNESAYIKIIAEKLAVIYQTSIERIAEETTNNALNIFNLPNT